MSESREIHGLVAEMKKSRAHWMIVWEDDQITSYYGDHPDKFAQSTKEAAWGMTYRLVRKHDATHCESCTSSCHGQTVILARRFVCCRDLESRVGCVSM